MKSDIKLDNVKITCPPDAPPLTLWLAEEFERWLREVHNLDVKVEFVLPPETIGEVGATSTLTNRENDIPGTPGVIDL